MVALGFLAAGCIGGDETGIGEPSANDSAAEANVAETCNVFCYSPDWAVDPACPAR